MTGQTQVLRVRNQAMSLRAGLRQQLVVRPRAQTLAVVSPDPATSAVLPAPDPAPVVAYDSRQLPPQPFGQVIDLVRTAQQTAAPVRAAFVIAHGQRGRPGESAEEIGITWQANDW